jgi:hypothetical protein
MDKEKFEVEWNDRMDTWEVKQDGENVYSDQSKKNCQEWMKRQEKKKFKRIDVYWRGSYGSGEFSKATITSISGGRVWISHGGTREKVWHNERIFIISKKNDDLAKKVAELEKTISKMTEQRDKLFEEMEKFDIERYGKEEEE